MFKSNGLVEGVLKIMNYYINMRYCYGYYNAFLSYFVFLALETSQSLWHYF